MLACLLLHVARTVTCRHHVQCTQAAFSAATGQQKAVNIHAVALFLFAQLYTRQAQRPDAMDVWPSEASQEAKLQNLQLLPAHQQGQSLPHQPVHSPLQNGGPGSQQEPVSPARSNSSRSSAGSQSSPGKIALVLALAQTRCTGM